MLIAAVVCESALAGSFTSNFSDPNQTGLTLNGGFTVDGLSYPAIENGHLVLTYNEGNLQGAAILDEIDPGAAVASFIAKFKLQLGQGSGNAADGFSFVFGDITSGSNFSEEGPGTLNGITVTWDTYDNGAQEAPALDIKVNGTVIASTKMAKADLMSEDLSNVVIQLNRNGTLNVEYKGNVVYTNLVLTEFVPTAGYLFGFGARTGGEYENCFLDDLDIKTTVAGAAVAASITSQPKSQAVDERAPAIFSVGYDGSAPFTFQWSKNGVDIAGATGSTYTLERASFADNGAKFKVTVSNSAGQISSSDAVLTVTSDKTPPTIASVHGSPDFVKVTVNFSEPVDATTGGNKANYQITGLSISSVSVRPAPNDHMVDLVTGQQTAGQSYTLTISNVKDIATAANVIAANSSAQFTAWTLSQGFLLFEYWANIANADIGSLKNDPRFQAGTPDLVGYLAGSFDTRTIFGDDTHDSYGAKISGWITPTETGDYDFFIRSDDASQLYLSENETPPDIIDGTPIAEETGCCQAFLEPGATQTTGFPIHLVAGRRYAVVALLKEGGGGDFLQVAWRKTTDTTSAATLPYMAGTYLSTYADPTGASIDITTQPSDTNGEQGKTAVFAVAVNASVPNIAYQWKKNGQSISGATGTSYTTPVLSLADSGTKYSVVVSIPGLSATSREAVLTVKSDIVPPQIAGAGALASQSGSTFDVGVSFNEAVEEASASNMANYKLSAGTISGITFYKSSPGVVLKVSGLTVGNTYTVTVMNVADISGNKMTSAEKEFAASKMKWGVVGGDELATGNGILAVANGGFDIYSDSTGEWGTYDEATFVYEEIVGDFDKKLRVEYQDLSSQWARAGLVARDVTNFGVDRATQEGGEAGRYQKVHVNPVGPTLTGPGTLGNATWEGNRRLATGAATTSAGGGGTPQYPDAWCRLQRKGDLFTIYRSDDGVTWTQLGTTTFDEPMPAKLYVGPEYAPENGNITQETSRGTFLAKFRDYGDYTAVQPAPTLTLGRTAAGLTLTFAGTLQWAEQVNGPWTDLSGASPQTVAPTGARKFYRAKR